jgi:hypothetical protein
MEPCQIVIESSEIQIGQSINSLGVEQWCLDSEYKDELP